jgi:hypothetical protein
MEREAEEKVRSKHGEKEEELSRLTQDKEKARKRSEAALKQAHEAELEEHQREIERLRD